MNTTKIPGGSHKSIPLGILNPLIAFTIIKHDAGGSYAWLLNVSLAFVLAVSSWQAYVEIKSFVTLVYNKGASEIAYSLLSAAYGHEAADSLIGDITQMYNETLSKSGEFSAKMGLLKESFTSLCPFLQSWLNTILHVFTIWQIVKSVL